MFKPANVFLLPTNKEAVKDDIILNTVNNFLCIMDRREHHNNFDTIHAKDSSFYEWDLVMIPHHLYITSDEVPIKNDWYINAFKELFQCGVHASESVCKSSGCKKVIATTDKSLALIKPNAMYPKLGQAILPLTQPPTSFIKKYIEEYNKGNIITNVMVEYEGVSGIRQLNMSKEITDRRPYDQANWTIDTKSILKINKDNTINIRMKLPVRDWNKEENRIADIKRMINLYVTTYTDGDIDTWITNNL